uniref:Insulin-like domain-containing protein n=1 Tax=Cyprinus carpio TaxID=7962 RepID=A0A8C2A9Q3_CYPCA
FQDAPLLRQTGVVAQSGERGTDRSSDAKRGIVEQCCQFYCNSYDLENYCNTERICRIHFA